MTKSPKKIFYGWYVVFSCCMVMCFGMCVIMNCPSMFVKPVSEGLGISRQAFSLNSTMISIAMMCIAFNAGRIFSRFGPKKVMMLASITMSISYAMYAFAQNITMFYVISLFVGASLALISSVPCSLLVTRWFNDRRGVAMGLVFMGSGIGGVFLNPLIGKLIPSIGWRSTYLVLAVLMLIVIAPCCFLVIRNDPAEMGLEPYGGLPVIMANAQESDGVTLKEAYRDIRFWVFLLTTATTTCCCSGIIQQMASYVTDIGYTYATASAIAAANLGLLAVGKILLGQAYDKAGVKKTSILTMLMLLVGILCLTQAETPAMLVAFLLLFGVGCAYTTVAYPIVTASLFGKKDYSAIYGIVTMASSLGTAVGSPLAASIYDATQSYLSAWMIYGVLITINLALMFILFSNNKKKAPMAA